MALHTGAPDSQSKTTAIVSYLTIIGWLVAYFAMYKDRKTVFASYHLRQSLLLNIIPMIFGLLWPVLFFAPFVWTILIALRIVYFIFWLIGFVYAIQGQQRPVPLLGEWAQRMFVSI